MKRVFLSLLFVLILFNIIVCNKSIDIYSAIKNNDLTRVKNIIKKNKNVLLNQDVNFDYPIFYAIQLKSEKIIKYLLQYEINHTLKSLDGTDIFQYADTFADFKIIRLLLESNIKKEILEKEKLKLLLSSVYGDRVELTKYLIKKGVDVNYQEPEYGQTALILCGFYGSYNVAKLLLENGARKDIKNKEGYTAEEFAKKFGYNDIANLIHNF